MAESTPIAGPITTCAFLCPVFERMDFVKKSSFTLPIISLSPCGALKSFAIVFPRLFSCSLRSNFKVPYAGIIQIRLRVEGGVCLPLSRIPPAPCADSSSSEKSLLDDENLESYSEIEMMVAADDGVRVVSVAEFERIEVKAYSAGDSAVRVAAERIARAERNDFFVAEFRTESPFGIIVRAAVNVCVEREVEPFVQRNVSGDAGLEPERCGFLAACVFGDPAEVCNDRAEGNVSAGLEGGACVREERVSGVIFDRLRSKAEVHRPVEHGRPASDAELRVPCHCAVVARDRPVFIAAFDVIVAKVFQCGARIEQTERKPEIDRGEFRADVVREKNLAHARDGFIGGRRRKRVARDFGKSFGTCDAGTGEARAPR